MGNTGSVLEHAVQMIAVGAGVAPPASQYPPGHVDVRVTAPLGLDDVQILNAWLQEPKRVDVSHVVIDPKLVSVGSQRDWDHQRCASAPRSANLRSDLESAIAKLVGRASSFAIPM